ncbi:unnamed protein product [Schistocephalus solidus]|uniref:DUF5753 domain-containing protein n=1 Tax=Schistocephalus solidus TaxID=70667 RepID=A0A183T9M6_SCHSO|nr:unnamed protein product [Schistocephalus solidus]
MPRTWITVRGPAPSPLSGLLDSVLTPGPGGGVEQRVRYMQDNSPSPHRRAVEHRVDKVETTSFALSDMVELDDRTVTHGMTHKLGTNE